MILCEKVTQKYADHRGIIDFSAELRGGEITCVLGKNGSGKTTLLGALTGLRRPQSGSVLLDGVDLWSGDNYYRLKDELSILPSDPYLFGDLTVRENLEFVGELRCRDRKRWMRIADLVDGLGMGAYLDSAVRDLSFGVSRKAHLLAGLIGEPRYIVWDEPHNGIDVMSNAIINDLLIDFRKRGATVIVTTHVIELVERIADRVIILDDARFVKDGLMNDIKSVGLYEFFRQSVDYPQRSTASV